MKNTVFLFFVWFCANMAHAQPSPFTASSLKEANLDSTQASTYNYYAKNPYVIDVSIIKFNPEVLKNAVSVTIAHNKFSTVATLIEKDQREEGNYGWLGRISDETSIFFTVFGNEVFSKFYLQNTPYTIIPLKGQYHLLLGFDPSISSLSKCAMDGDTHITTHEPPPNSPTFSTKKVSQKPLSITNHDETTCNLRALIVFTNEADAFFDSPNMRMVAQGMVDEANVAYAQSEINFRMELARAMNVNYAQTGGTSTETVYGASFDYYDDLIRMRNGTNGYAAIPDIRNRVQADIVVMIRRHEWSCGFWGEAFGVPTGSFDPDPANAFCMVIDCWSSPLVGGRFSFAHEIGHVQGGRHDNDNGTPNYARGYVLNNSGNSLRTIMSTSNSVTCSTPFDGCRINFFSNPNVTFGSVPVGTQDRDNARRLRETRDIMLTHRETAENLVVTTDDYLDETIVNHLAIETITTSGNVIAHNGSVARFRAGTSIRLLPGAQAERGSFFRGYIIQNPCQQQPQNLVNKNSQEPSNSIDVASESVLSIYPNPATNTITIRTSSTVRTVSRLRLYNIFGEQSLTDFQKTTGNGLSRTEYQCDISALSDGVYYVSAEIDGVVQVARFVVLSGKK